MTAGFIPQAGVNVTIFSVILEVLAEKEVSSTFKDVLRKVATDSRRLRVCS
jgi:hypothetical protein